MFFTETQRSHIQNVIHRHFPKFQRARPSMKITPLVFALLGSSRLRLVLSAPIEGQTRAVYERSGGLSDVYDDASSAQQVHTRSGGLSDVYDGTAQDV